MTLERPIYDLLEKEPFFANFLLACKIDFTQDTKVVPTAGVMVQRGVINFVINTDFYFSKTRLEQVAVLKHEILHVLFDHTGKRSKGPINRAAKNIAMDCAINQYITDLPEGGVTLETVSKLVGKNIKAGEVWEYYYELMKDKAKENSKGAPGNHEYMEGNSDGSSIEIEDESEAAINRAAIQDAATKAIKASAGNIPKSIQGILGQFNRAPTLPWSQILRNFVANARHVETRNSRSRAHRRYDLDQPGKRKIKRLVLGVCIDSSGSVSDELYAKFLHEISVVAKNTDTTYLIHADCEVQHVDVIKDGKMSKEKHSKRHGNGGTAYSPAINHCKKLDCDAIIYFGDMDAADTPQNPGVPFLWVRSGNQEPPGKFGRILDVA